MPAPSSLNLLLLFLVGGAAPIAFAGVLSGAGMLGVWRSSLGSSVVLRSRIDAVHGATE